MLKHHAVAAAVLVPLDNQRQIVYSNYYSMTFEQLMEQQRMISKKYNAAFRAGASQEVMNQMLGHMDAIRHAMWELGYKQSFDASNNGDPFEDSIA
jgi:hypothetical protein